MGGGQPHPRQPLPGPRLRRLGDLQRLAPPRSGWRSRATAGRRFAKAVTITEPNQTGPDQRVRLPGGRRGRQRLRLGRIRPPEPQRPQDDLRAPLERRRRHLVGVRAGRRRPRLMPGCCLPNTTLPRRHPRALRRQPRPPRPPLPGLGGLGRQPVRRQVHPVDRLRSTPGQRRSSSTTTRTRRRPTSSSRQVAAGPGGAVAVNFYDRRAACPEDPSILPERRRPDELLHRRRRCRRSRTTEPAPCRSAATSASRTSPGTRSSPARRSTGSTRWPARRTPTRARPAPSSATTSASRSRESNVYTLAVSTHYPSGVIMADGGVPVYYQQQVLETVSRTALGL